MIASDAKPPAGLTLTAVPDGDLRTHYNQLSLQLSLKQLSCGIPALSVGEISNGTRVVFRSLYGVRAEDDFTNSISVLLNEAECLLALLGMLPWSAGATHPHPDGPTADMGSLPTPQVQRSSGH